MPDQAYRSTWATYQAAWEDISSDERQSHLNVSVTGDCVYTDPQTQCDGRKELFAYIEQFRESLPGASFKNHKFTDHHTQSLAEWTLHDANGAELQSGTSYALFGEDGRLTYVTGFF